MSRKKLMTTIYLNPEQVVELARLSEHTRVPQAEYIRQGVDLLLAILVDVEQRNADAATEKQVEMLAKIRELMATRGRSPSFDELAAEIGISGVAALKRCRQLRDRGLVDWEERKPHTLRVTMLRGGGSAS